MKKHLIRIVSLVVTLLILASTVLAALPASAALTYRLGDASAPSTSYKNGRYYTNITNITLTGDDRTNVIAAALSQLGYQEGSSSSALSGTAGGSLNYTEYWRNMVGGTFSGGEPWAWCACFVSWALYQGRATDQSNYSDLYRNHIGSTTYIWKEISCSQWVNGLSNAGYYKKSANRGGTYTPQYGDLIFFKNSKGPCHIGIVLYVKGGRVYTVEGNTSSGTGLEANGGGVYFKNYSLTYSSLHGYGVLPYKKTDASARIDYTGANPTPGLYMTNTAKYFYKDAAMTTRHSFNIPQYRMIECVEVVSNSVLKVKYDGTVGYVANNTDRVIQVTSTGKSGGAAVAGNLAHGATTTTFWTDDAGRQDVNVTTRGYSAKLTDGVASQLEPVYGDSGNVGDWFAFFHNAEAADQNCDDGVGHIMLDLGSSQSVASVLANISTVSGTAPASIEVWVGEDQWSLTSVGNMSFPSADYGWAGINFTATKARYVRLDVTMNAYWALINEIEVYGTAQDKVPAGGATSTPSVEEWAHDAIGATVVDESGQVPLGSVTPSGAGCVFGMPLTDGKITTAVTLTDGAWFTVQKYWNCGMTNEQIEAGEPCIGKVTLDLGKTLALEAVKLHLANTQMASPNGGQINAPAPDAIKITLLDENRATVASGSITPKKDTEIVYWSDAYVANQAKARYVVVEVTVGASGMYALFDEIAVFGAVVEEDDNIALNKNVNAPAGVRDYTANLTDGVAEGECMPGVNNADWYGLFTNADAADQNCPTGTAEIIIDLEKNYDLTEVKANIAFTEGVYAPTSVIASVATSENGTYTEIGELTGTFEGGSSYWITVDATGAMGRYLKLTVTVDTVSEWSYWALLNEVKAYGTENTDPVITRLRGDVNGDEVIDMKDYGLLKRYCFATANLDAEAVLACDVNNDGIIDMKDYNALKRYCFGTGTIEVPYV